MSFVPKEANADWVVQYWDNNACVFRTKIFEQYKKAKNWATNSMNDPSISSAIVMRVHYAVYKETQVVIANNEIPHITKKVSEQEEHSCDTCIHIDVLCYREPCVWCYDHNSNIYMHWESRRD